MTSFSFPKNLPALLSMLFLTGSLFSQTTWTGSASTDWGNGANWSAGVPDANDDVTIPNVANDPVISVAGAVAKYVNVQSGGVLTLSATGTLTINGSASQGILNQGTITNSGIISVGNTSAVGTVGIYNESILTNNMGGQINIDRPINIGLKNTSSSTVSNSGTFNIGAIVSPGLDGIRNDGTFNNNASGQININRTTLIGLFNLNGSFSNQGTIQIGSVASVGTTGLYSAATFNNNTGGQITINRSSQEGIECYGAVFTNQATIVIGNNATTAVNTGIRCDGTFNNNTGGHINIDRATALGIDIAYPGGIFNNQGTIDIGATAFSGYYGIYVNQTFNNNTGGEIHIDRASTIGVDVRGGTFTNLSTLTIGELVPIPNLIHQGITQSGSFLNGIGGIVEGTGNLLNSIFTNNGGTLSPGYSPGKLTFTGSEDFNNAITSIEVNGTGTAGVHFDQVVVSGAATLGGTLALSLNYPAASGDEIPILSATAISGTFSSVTGLPANWYVGYAPPEVILSYDKPFNYWTGSVNTSWNNAGNWTAGVPAASHYVIIPDVTNDPVIGAAGAVAHSVRVLNGAILNVSPIGTLAINGSGNQGILNQGTVQNDGVIQIGNTSTVGNYGILNEATFNNNAGGQVHIDRCATSGIELKTNTFSNAGTVAIGALMPMTNLMSGSSGTFSNGMGGTLYGTGSIPPARFTNAGGTLSPGYSPGKLTFSGSENFSSSHLVIEVNGAGTAGVHFDQLELTGAGAVATLGGTLALSVNYSPAVGDYMFIVNATSISGTFASATGLPAGWYLSYTNREVVLSYGVTTQATWTGSVEADWHKAGNWSPPLLPGTVTNVTIPDLPNDPVISAPATEARSVTVQTGAALTVTSAGELNLDGIIGGSSIYVQGTVQNNGLIHVGAAINGGGTGIYVEGTFNNNAGGTITIDRTANQGIFIYPGTFNNHGTLVIGGAASPGLRGIFNQATFNNNTGGQIFIDRSTSSGLTHSFGAFNNYATITIGGSQSVGIYGISNNTGGSFNNNPGGHIHIDRATGGGINNVNSGAVFNNQAIITIGETASPGSYGIDNDREFNNLVGGHIHIDHATVAGIRLISNNLSNQGNITIGALSPISTLISNQGSGTFSNNAGGILKGTGSISSTRFANNGGTLSPGYSPGTMAFDGAEDFNTGILQMEIVESGGVVTKDLVSVSGNAALTGGILNILAGSTVPGGTHQLLSFTGNPGSTQFTTVNFPALCGGCSLVYSATGVSLNNSMACFPNLTLNNMTLLTGTYRSQGDLTSGMSTVGNGSTVEFKSDTGVLLQAGFEVQLGGVFEAVISACQ